MISQSKSADELAWWMALHCAEKVGAATFHRLLKKFGSPHDALTQASADTLQGVPGADSSLLDSIVFAAIRIDYTRKLLERLNEHGVTIITFEDPDFPATLRRLKWPPPVLYLKGDYDEERDSRAVGIVGATHPAARAFRTAYRSAGALVNQGYTIVSGGAHGIDTAAHLAPLDAGGRT
ncbi:MAG: DNA-processing protein DprA, partial [Planctomycetes bacterium]|nr:DNA-processing protein DprA [Planctomycetota bacterium]